MRYLIVILLLAGCTMPAETMKEEHQYFKSTCNVICGSENIENFKYQPTGQTFGGYECKCKSTWVFDRMSK